MARLPRLYRVVGTWPDGSTKTRRYLTPEAAEERKMRWLTGANVEGDDDHDETAAPQSLAISVIVTPSHPITFPHAAGDATTFDLPDAVASRQDWVTLANWLGLSDGSIQIIHTIRDEHGMQLVVEYEGDPAHPGRHAPKLWRVQIESE